MLVIHFIYLRNGHPMKKIWLSFFCQKFVFRYIRHFKIIIPGYCVANTVGSKLLLGQRRFLFDGKEIEAKMQVHYMSFSAHADAKGITQLIRQCQPSNVVLVHGEDLVMDFLRGRVKDELSKDEIDIKKKILSIYICRNSLF